MSSIVGAITGGGDSGMNFRAKQADLIQAATKAQADEQYGNVQTGLQGQQQFLQALQAQNGLGNQSSVFNQLQGVANGQGPNPAEAMLNNATGANVSNQAALMAGQRGSSSNPGLLARQAAMQGANTQQQAAGQGAALQAQQSLGALNQLGGIAGQQVGQQANATNAYTQSAQGAQANILNAINGVNANNVAMQGNANNANAALAGQVAKGQMDFFSGITNSAGKGLAMMADGGAVGEVGSSGVVSGPKSKVGQFMVSMLNETPQMEEESKMKQAGNSLGDGLFHAGSSLFSSSAPVGTMAGGAGDAIAGAAPLAMMAARGGKVPALVSPGEKYLSPKDVQQVKAGANPMQEGKTIPGKPKVGGAKNDYANDTVSATLEEGGIVLPRSVTQSKDPAKKAAEFVAAVMKRKSHKG